MNTSNDEISGSRSQSDERVTTIYLLVAVELLNDTGCVTFCLAIIIQPNVFGLFPKIFAIGRFSHFLSWSLARACRYVWIMVGEKLDLRTLHPQLTLLERFSFFRGFISSIGNAWRSEDVSCFSEQFVNQTLSGHNLLLMMRSIGNLLNGFRAWIDRNSGLFSQFYRWGLSGPFHRRRSEWLLRCRCLLLLWDFLLFLWRRLFLWSRLLLWCSLLLWGRRFLWRYQSER